MKLLYIAVAGSCLGACTIAQENNSVVTAQPYIGLQERVHRDELKELLDVDPMRTEWCAAFVNAVLELDGIPGSDSVSDVPLMARSFLFWGEHVDPADIQRGDIVVFPRGNQGWQGHVGFFAGHDLDNNWVIVGGNQDNTVSYAIYKPTTALGVRRWVPAQPVSD